MAYPIEPGMVPVRSPTATTCTPGRCSSSCQRRCRADNGHVVAAAGCPLLHHSGIADGGGYLCGFDCASTSSVGTVNQTGGTLTVNDNADGDSSSVAAPPISRSAHTTSSGGTVNANTNVASAPVVMAPARWTKPAASSTPPTTLHRSLRGRNRRLGIYRAEHSTNRAPTDRRRGRQRHLYRQRQRGGNLKAAGLELGRDAGARGSSTSTAETSPLPRLSRALGTGTLFSAGHPHSSASSTTFIQGLTVSIFKPAERCSTPRLSPTPSRDPCSTRLPSVRRLDGGLTKTGSGILTLTGRSPFTGDTSVNAGTLTVTGTGATLDSSLKSRSGSGLTATMNVGSGLVVTAGSSWRRRGGGNGTLNLDTGAHWP